MNAETPLTAVLRAAARNTDKLLLAELTPFDLTPPRLEMLAAYAENPGSSMSEAARVCDMAVQSASTATATLTTKGWIVSDPPVNLRRAVNVTDAGLEVLAAAWDATRPLEKRIATLLGATGIRRLRDTASVLAADAADPGTGTEPAEDPRFAEVGNAATGLYYRALMWADARKTDTIPVSVVRKWSSPQAGVAQRLIAAGLWKHDGDAAYRIR